eukprot:7906550-Pyramimonas_sp.AAC.1
MWRPQSWSLAAWSPASGVEDGWSGTCRPRLLLVAASRSASARLFGFGVSLLRVQPSVLHDHRLCLLLLGDPLVELAGDHSPRLVESRGQHVLQARVVGMLRVAPNGTLHLHDPPRYELGPRQIRDIDLVVLDEVPQGLEQKTDLVRRGAAGRHPAAGDVVVRVARDAQPRGAHA